jgi:hypothetical protein
MSTMKCLKCDKMCADFVDLEAHTAGHHEGYWPFYCLECPNIRLPTEDSLRRHMEQIHGKLDFVVSLLSITFWRLPYVSFTDVSSHKKERLSLSLA